MSCNKNPMMRTSTDHEAWLASGAEPPITSELPIVDAHLHSWHRGEQRYFVEEFARDLAASGHRVVATVATDCGAMYRSEGPAHLRSVGETEFMVGMSAIAASGKYTDCRVAASIVAHADLTLGEKTRELLEAHRDAANGRLVGVRHTAKWDEDPVVRGSIGPGRAGLYTESIFQAGFKLLAEMGLVFDASIYHPQLPDVIALAHAHPEVPIVVIHSASPLGFGSYSGRGALVHADWLTHMRELAKCPNAYVKLGGLLMCLRNYDPATADRPISSEQLAALWRPYIEPCIDLFGAQRCMVAGNYPVDRAGLPYGTIWNMFKRITAGCSEQEKRWIFSDTAKHLYRIE